MANHTSFDIEENEIALLARMGDRMADQARMFDPASTAPENLPEGTVRLNLSARKFEKLGPGGVWSDALEYLAMKVNELQSAAVLQVLQAAYPIGSVYINANVDTNPSTLLGFGSWTAIGAGRVLVGQDISNSVFDVLGETGGQANAEVVAHTHTGSIGDAGAHTHTVYGDSEHGGTNGFGDTTASHSRLNVTVTTSSAGNHSHSLAINSSGISGVNANLQPYLVVKMWRRTA